MYAITKMFIAFSLVSFSLASSHAVASLLTIGPDGINAINLTLADGMTLLDGSGSGIGQVEHSRPAMMGVDAANDLNSSVNPAAVFRQDDMPTAADLIKVTDDDPSGLAKHAMKVAGVMISGDPSAKGVAPGASLYASAHLTGAGAGATNHGLTILALQGVTTSCCATKRKSRQSQLL